MSSETMSGFVLQAVEERCTRYADYVSLRIQEVTAELAQLNELKTRLTAKGPLDDAVHDVWPEFLERLKGPGGKNWGHDLAWIDERAKKKNLKPERLLEALWNKAGLSSPSRSTIFGSEAEQR